MKRGLEILGIGIISIDSRNCVMLRAEQTPGKAYLEKQGEDCNLMDWYLDVLRKHKDKLLGITRYVVSDAWFLKARRLILRNSTFSVARFSTLKEEGLTQSRPIQRQ